jgi:7-cyano-7-deazaguanine synthase in queuosine biosynthesis
MHFAGSREKASSEVLRSAQDDKRSFVSADNVILLVLTRSFAHAEGMSSRRIAFGLLRAGIKNFEAAIGKST